jgi:hypothetical protein
MLCILLTHGMSYRRGIPIWPGSDLPEDFYFLLLRGYLSERQEDPIEKTLISGIFSNFSQCLIFTIQGQRLPPPTFRYDRKQDILSVCSLPVIADLHQSARLLFK